MSDKTALKLWLQLAKTSARLQSEITARLRTDYGQSMTRFDVLSQLARTDGKRLGVSALSRMLIASSGNISRLLDRMEKEGLLERSPGRHDRRSIMIGLTPAGAALFARMARDHEHWVSEILSDMPKANQQELLDGLILLQEIMPAKPA
jgi:DNA-binding MarR family transcriptional regulator